MSRLTVEAGNPYDLSPEESVEVLAVLSDADSDLKVEVIRPDEKGYGVTVDEVLRLYYENPELAVAQASALAALFRWLRQRVQKDGRKRTVIIYGPDGSPLKSFEIDDPEREPVEGPPSGERRLPSTR